MSSAPGGAAKILRLQMVRRERYSTEAVEQSTAILRLASATLIARDGIEVRATPRSMTSDPAANALAAKVAGETVGGRKCHGFGLRQPVELPNKFSAAINRR